MCFNLFYKYLRSVAAALVAVLFCFTQCGSGELFIPPKPESPVIAPALLPEPPEYVTQVPGEPEVPSSEASTSSEDTTPVSPQQSAPPPPAPDPPSDPFYKAPANETRAIWLSFLEMQEILMNKTEAQFTRAIEEYFDNCKAQGLNTVIAHARSHGDAMYPSRYFPTSCYFTGSRQDSAPFDPFGIMVRQAHARGLKIEAWVNPFRGPRSDMPFSPNDIFAKMEAEGMAFRCASGGWEYCFLNPGEPEMRRLVIDGVVEIVESYDVDGIHFDDYFYPPLAPEIDAATYERYGEGKTLTEFRTDSVSELISGVYSAVKALKDIPFGISPAGNIDNVYGACADVRLWGSKPGYVDYLAPQIYWSYGEGTLPYKKSLAEWEAVVTSPQVKLIVGLAAYKVGENKYWMEGNILARQRADAMKTENYGGFMLFRYEQYFSAECDTERASMRSSIAKG